MRPLINLKYLKRCFVSANRKNPGQLTSTIYALSSGYGKCGVAVIRVSGPNARKAAENLGGRLPPPRVASLRKLKDPVTNEILDSGLLLWFPGPKSFTGEDCCEFQIHGGPAVITAVLGALAKIDHLRPAEQGEFTKRAFYSGKLDLTSIEGLADLINAETEFQRKQAVIQMEGALFDTYSNWSKILTKNLANLEAYIDFDEDQNLESTLIEQTRNELDKLREKLKFHLRDGRKGERLRSGVNVTILGAPNVGKSSLLNILSRQPTAIVSSIPGTTRDLIKTNIDIRGYPVNISDTAGLRDFSKDPIEKEGIERAKQAAAHSDLIILVLDGENLFSWLKMKNLENGQIFDNLDEYLKHIGLGDELKGMKSNESEKQKFIIINKMDLIDSDNFDNLTKNNNRICFMSCKTKQGLETMVQKLSAELNDLCGSPNKLNPSYSQARHRFCIKECLSALDRFFDYGPEEIDIAAQEIRNALFSIGKITGTVTTEDILDVIFKDFCIGK